MISVQFTKAQIEEIVHKIAIMQDGMADDPEDCIAASYGLTKDTLEELDRKFQDIGRLARTATVELTDHEADAVWGELDNAADIANSNIKCGSEYRTAYKSFKDGMARIANARVEQNRLT